ncbi:hypothetical protein DNTS_014801 [Danionella cerebrum]|uniref:Uncharacterized protein n=1 Tax=Danionella cerebrum TaxID=2873325 RepID=A0A553N204_9TELE|nr:hypothetical protein DNTS_014801 [Danionella translucida]
MVMLNETYPASAAPLSVQQWETGGAAKLDLLELSKYHVFSSVERRQEAQCFLRLTDNDDVNECEGH